MMNEAVNSFETSASIYKITNATSQKTAVFRVILFCNLNFERKGTKISHAFAVKRI
jgi:hypothetical protein